MRVFPKGHLTRRALGWMLLALSAVPAFPQTYRTGAIAGVLWVQPTPICASNADTWYSPTLYTLPNGNLAFLAHSGRWPGSSCQVQSPIDSFYGASRSASTGAWTTADNAPTTCANLVGAYRRCQYLYTPGTDGKIVNPGPIGNPSVVKIGSIYYMAFNGGNADYITGKVYWATSSDGINWSAYNVSPPLGQLWTPIIGSRYHDCDELPGVAEGIGEIALAYDASDTSGGPNGTFYIYFSNWSNVGLDTWAFRFGYAPASPFGLGGNRQIWHNGVWKASSGSLIWRSDIDSGRLGDPSEPTLNIGEGQNSAGAYGFGGGDLRQDPVTGKWLHVFFGADQHALWSQTATMLRDNLWSSPSGINSQTVKALYPGNYLDQGNSVHIEYEVGLWYGATGSRTGWWLYDPVNFLNCPAAYTGLGIAPVELCSGDPPTISATAPTSGPSGGGTSVRITGTNLDCASSVTFGGTAGTLVAKAPLELTVTAPSHAAGAVNVAVTTPAGTATRPSGFTYTPPVYEGFYESLDCNYAAGWAWDSNRPNDPINVDVYDGTTLLGSPPANAFRQDLLNAGKGNGSHGFAFALPASVRNGLAHSLAVKFGGTSTPLIWSPRSVTCQPLTIAKPGPEVGTVTSNPTGILCGSDCSEYYPSNTSVSLTATPGSGSTFGGWSGAADCSDGLVTLAASRSCTATFTPAVRVIWLQPQASAGFGTPGSLVIAGSAANAPPGTGVRVTWKDLTANGPSMVEPYQPVPDANGYWFHEILGANYSHQYAVTATFGATTSIPCTYPGNGGPFFGCP